MNRSIKTLSLTLLLCAPIAHSMQSLQGTCTDAMKSIFEYAMWIDSNGLDISETPKEKKATFNTESGGSIHMTWSTPMPKGNKYTNNPNGLWQTLKRALKGSYQLQMVSKDFMRVFWDCNHFASQNRFTLEEKDEVIATLLRQWNQGNFHDTYLNFSPIPPIADMAVNMGASLLPILEGSIVTTRKCRPEFVRVVVDAGNSEVINQVNSWDSTPLLNAIVYAGFSEKDKNGHLKIIKLLLTHPDIQVNPITGQTKQRCPLYWAVYHSKIEIIKLLLAHPDIQVNSVDGYHTGETALFAAVKTSWPSLALFRSVIDLLINAGADSSVKNKDGQTALDVARSYTTADKAEELERALAMEK